MKNLVILGGGYGGTTLLHELLDHKIPADTQLILVDRMPFQGLKTEYYALAAGTSSDMELRVKFPVHPKLSIRYGEVNGINMDEKSISFAEGEPLQYDQLVIALGCVDNFHGVPGADTFTCTIQTFEATRETYRRVNNLPPQSTVNIVGGGLSGIEIAAEIRESREDLHVRILDRGERLLSASPPRLSKYVQDWFKDHNVEIRNKINISRVEEDCVYNGPDERIPADITVWTAGIRPVPLVDELNVNQDNSGRVILDDLYRIPGRPEIFVCGDCASLPFAASAQAAEAQAEQIANVIVAGWKGEQPKVQPLKLKGTLGALGKHAGFGSGFGFGGKSSVTGRVPRLLKSGVLWMSRHHFG
ncbi:NAD(P)/FAD-dependent oxidoreductase [Paenibacillus wulumuqiensis]|uniref:NAD(P)/FAD-dependent oxidoreductase n=1 Tax=Paenibacillus wulumuqiensis TaxID=1567107 RepID=UPI0006194B78|nr:FAD-dependent oxidoreductase [Paenibacillus wulumuqiensis]